MLLSALIKLNSLDPSLILGSLGRPLQAWVLGQVQRGDAKLAGELHEENSIRPYTVSTLLDDRGVPLRAQRRLEPGEGCWLRVTSLEDRLSNVLLSRVLPNLPPSLEIYKMQFRVDGYTLNRYEHPWAGQQDWRDYAAEPPGPVLPGARLEFLSPTAFRDKGNDQVLPDPRLVFGSLFERWNAFAPEAMRIDAAWPDFVARCVLIDELTRLNSERWIFAGGSRGAATGFTGTVGYRLVSAHKSGQWRSAWDGAAEVLGVLADFAFYSGVGHHTTVGMGQTRRLK